MNRLKELREARELNQSDIAKKLNISTAAYSYYENEKRDVPTNVLKLLSDFFNCSIDYILGKTDIRNPEIEIDKDKINIGLSTKDYNPPTKEQQEKIETNIPDQNIDTLKSFLSNDFTLIYNSLSRMEKRRIWLSILDYIALDKDYNMKIFFI